MAVADPEFVCVGYKKMWLSRYQKFGNRVGYLSPTTPRRSTHAIGIK